MHTQIHKMKAADNSEKTNLHPRNLHRSRYDFELLIANCPALKQHVAINVHGIETIDFSNPVSVKLLNKALLQTYYGIQNWDIPRNFLCPQFPEEQIIFIISLIC